MGVQKLKQMKTKGTKNRMTTEIIKVALKKIKLLKKEQGNRHKTLITFIQTEKKRDPK